MKGSKMRLVLRLVGIGWYVGICIGGGAALGLWLDRTTGLSPLLTLAGLGIGIAAAVIGMTRMLMAVLAGNSRAEGKGRE